MIVIAKGLIPLSSLSIVSRMVMWESRQWLGKNIIKSTQIKTTPGKHGKVRALAATI